MACSTVNIKKSWIIKPTMNISLGLRAFIVTFTPKASKGNNKNKEKQKKWFCDALIYR